MWVRSNTGRVFCALATSVTFQVCQTVIVSFVMCECRHSVTPWECVTCVTVCANLVGGGGCM